MSVSGSDSSQTLTASGGSGSYTWSIPGGSGTLSNPNGSSTIYTTPSSNANCANNPTVRLTDSAGQYVDLPMAVNGYAYQAEAVRITADDWCNPGQTITTCGMNTYHYNCQGELIPNFNQHPNPCASSTNTIGSSCTTCYNINICDGCSTYCGGVAYKLSISPEDRTLPFPYLRNGGCCPWNAPAQPGPNDTGTGCSGSPVNPNVAAGSAGNIKSGNLYDSVDVGSIMLSYNSLGSTTIPPVAPKWTHNYNTILTMFSDGVTLALSTPDGNVIYFRKSGSTYYPEPRSGDTSRIVKNANGTYTQTLKNGKVYQFNSSGYPTSITDRNNNTTTFTYSGWNLTSVTDQNGRATTLTYDSGGRITKIKDPFQRTYTLTNSGYPNYLLTQITDPLGRAWSFTYNSQVYGQMLTKTDPAGKTTTYTYDNKGRLLTATDPENKTRLMTYTLAGTTTFTEKDGGVWTYTYDPTYAVKTAKTDALGNTTRYVYDLKRNLISTTAPGGSTTTYTYDANSNVTSVTDPLGHTTSYTYNSMNLVTSVTDPRGAVTIYAYDSRGNLTTITAPLGNVTNFAYDSKGNVTSITDAYSHTTTLAYDSQNNLISITDHLNRLTAFTYDAVGNRLSMTDPLGNTTSYVYNTLNQMTQVTDPRGNITNYTYDYKGNVLTTTDANGKTTAYAYNYRGQVTQITDTLNNITQMTYGPLGCGSGCGGAEKLASLTDALNHTTLYTYDLAGRLTTENDPLDRDMTYTYDAEGNILTRTKPDGTTIIYAYDANSRLIQKQYSDGSITQFQYDANGNMTYAGNQFITYNFAYDANNRMTGVSDSNGRTIQYQYDTIGNRTQMITPENRTIIYTYDANRRLTGITSNNGTFGFTYDDAGRRSTLTYPNNTWVTYTYDYSSNVTRVWHRTQGGTNIADINYTYDNVNNRLTRVDTATSGSEQAGVEAMNYDAANELLNLNSIVYGYDYNGNRIQKVDGSKTTTYTYDDETILTRVDITGTTNSVITYAYDPFGRRIEKNVNGTMTRYVYDKEAIILEYDQSGMVTTRYTHGLNIDEPYDMEKSGQVSYYHADALGSIVALTNAAGSVAHAYTYDSFGNILSGAPIQPFTYTAREYDTETGLYFYRARYYDSKVGRFLQRDPILHPPLGNFKECGVNNPGLQNGAPSFDDLRKESQNLNPYIYTRNNPIRFVDSSGLACGTGWIEPYVPDNYGLWSFTGPCQNHDDCYDSCGSSKMMCDLKFFRDMINVCSAVSVISGAYWACNSAAITYFAAVRVGGQSAFDKAQKCCIK